MKRASALPLVTPAPSGRELNDHSRTSLADTRLHCSKPLRTRRGRLVVVSYVDVDEARARLIGGLRELDLLVNRNRHSGIVSLARD